MRKFNEPKARRPNWPDLVLQTFNSNLFASIFQGLKVLSRVFNPIKPFQNTQNDKIENK